MTKFKKEPVWWNGQVIESREVTLPLATHALHYGTAAFEGIRFYETGEDSRAIFRLRDHLRRLKYSSQRLSLPLGYKLSELEQAVVDTVRAGEYRSGYIRPIVWRGEGGLGLNPIANRVEVAVLVLPWEDYLVKDGIKTKIVSWRKIPQASIDPRAKWSGVYINSVLAHQEAKQARADEALLLDQTGYLAEGAGENVFLVKKNTLHTPEVGVILPGITRQTVIALAKGLGLKVVERRIKPEEIKDFNECFLTGTAAEITPVSFIDDHCFNQEKVGPVTRNLSAKFFAAVMGEEKKHRRWLTKVD